MEYKKKRKNTIKRGAKKASYNKIDVNKILDSSEICNIAFNINGLAQVQPINFGRNGSKIYIHGSLKNRMTNNLIEVGTVCLSVMHLDSMKLSRSAFHHSVNFRSAIVFGIVKELKTKKEKLFGLKTIINHFVPDRWEYCREPTDKELEVTKVLEIKIETASVKIADSSVVDNKEDLELDYWAGQIPIKTICEYPLPTNNLKKGIKVPDHILEFYEKRKDGF